MKFKVPFTFSNLDILKKRSKIFEKLVSSKKGKMDEYLKAAGEKISKKEYISVCYNYFFMNLVFFFIISSSVLFFLKVGYSFLLLGLGISLLISGFIFINQMYYPKMFSVNKSKSIDKNLISALQDMAVQLDSGVPIFKILVNISSADYGEVSEEFRKITKEINSGVPQIEALERAGKINSSEYFRRVLWQISNGMRSGSDIGIVIKEEIRFLNDEQTIQIQSYGSRLNPIIMFYMLIAIIMPSLGITFLIIISSMINLPVKIVYLIFFLIFIFVVFIQFMFLGLIKSRRPSLL